MGDLIWFSEIDAASCPTVLAIERLSNDIPDQFDLAQNFPYPFNPTTNITYSLPQNTAVSLAIYTTLGQEVACLVDNQEQTAGTYK
jgi:hypothetical protein